MTKSVLLLLAVSFCAAANAATLQAGPGETYPTPCAAIAAAHDGDVIEIQAALYVGDVCVVRPNNLTLRGVNGRPHLDAHDASSQGKAIWVIKGNNALVENIEFSGASVPDHNGAGIRAEGVDWTVRNCYFHDNQDGILESNVANSHILIEFSEFDHNGFGDGQSHNLYIGHAAELTFRFNWSHRAKTGHLLKSRAAVNYILFNRLSDDDSGDASYETDLPNGGTAYMIGNIIQQSKNSANSTILTYLEEGTNALNPDHNLYVFNNTFVNDRPNGSTFVRVSSPGSAQVINNIFNGPGTVCPQNCTLVATNFVGDPLFVNAGNFDYHLLAGSPAIDGGTDLRAFDPTFEYLHPACGEQRITTGAAIDIGAFEFGGAGTPLVCR
ncbi:MAG TPA: choice-of-anchor Q domain-containing protein [Bryobacteraceae bacterium]|nr:choice-of-anchor Q domain-containing protein [Bryobacteraceae bacterium]